MITEDYVSFETAKLLKEKGFDSECDYLYVNGNIVRAQGGKCNWNKGETIFTDYKNECSAPTLQMAMKWLREEKHIFVELSVDTMIKSAITWRLFEFPSLIMMPYEGWEYNYEQACEAAIKYCLKNLI